MRKLMFVCVFLLEILSCNYEVNFYKQAYDDDLGVIPLIEPFRLTSPTKDTFWHFKLDTVYRKNINFTNVIWIGVKDSLIFGYGDTIWSPSYYFIFNTTNSLFYYTKDSLKWAREATNIYQINLDDLHRVADIYKNFESDWRTLPWLPKEFNQTVQTTDR